jgi:hypothetical protein
MNKLMMTAASLALMGISAGPVLAQSSPATDAPAMTAPNNSSTTLPRDTAPPNAAPMQQDQAPMSSRDSTSAVAPAQGSTQSSADSSDNSAAQPTKASHRMHHKQMDATKASGSKSTDHDAEQLNQQELGKIQSPS